MTGSRQLAEGSWQKGKSMYFRIIHTVQRFGRVSTASFLLPFALVATLAFVAGCETSDPMEQMYNGPSKALSDPMNYSPDMSNADVMGGGVATYNDKAMQQDINEVVEP
jgi:hypothetical protein